MKRIVGYLKDEQGIETLEWIAVGALIIAVAIAIYPGTLQAGLTTVINGVRDKLLTLTT
jgi:Flp pilus assembly pilin Flp